MDEITLYYDYIVFISFGVPENNALILIRASSIVIFQITYFGFYRLLIDTPTMSHHTYAADTHFALLVKKSCNS
jgi:hypothetical protein